MELHEVLAQEENLEEITLERTAPPEHVHVANAVHRLLDERGIRAPVHVAEQLRAAYEAAPTLHRPHVRSQRVTDFDGLLTVSKHAGRRCDLVHVRSSGTFLVIGEDDVRSGHELAHRPVAAVYVTPQVELSELALSLDRLTGHLLHPAAERL